MTPPLPPTSTQPLRVAYLGPAGTNTHAAALDLFRAPGGALLQPEATIRGVFDAVSDGRADRGVVPVENSTEGRVEQTLDCLLELPPVIVREHVAEIHHYLMAPAGTQLERLQRVLSHPQALAQCRGWLDQHLPSAEQILMSSTAAAARDSVGAHHTAAIAPLVAAELHGLEVLAHKIEDVAHNATRFAVIGLEDAGAPSGCDKTSIAFSTKHERGALRRVLEALDDAGVNLTRIESRPLAGRRWEYAFFADLEGSRFDASVARALDQLRPLCGMVKLLGSYPAAEPPATQR